MPGVMAYLKTLLLFASIWQLYLFPSYAATIPSLVRDAHGVPHPASPIVSLKSHSAPSRTDRMSSGRSIEHLVHPGFQSFVEIGNGWNMYYSSWQAATLPIQPAAWALTTLYTYFQTQARTDWRAQKPQQVLKGALGVIQLTIICPERAIPLDFVEKFMTQMLAITANGWTGTYQVMLSQAALDMSIGVELSIAAGMGVT